jgi:hypothetical protein
VPANHRGERIGVSRVQGPNLRHLARPRLDTARLALWQRDVREIDARHQLNSTPRGNVSPSTRLLITRWRVEWMQYACVGLKAARDHGCDHTGAERRETVAEPGRFLNLDALLHTGASHESIIHGLESAALTERQRAQ